MTCGCGQQYMRAELVGNAAMRQHEGRAHMVVPVVAIVHGVLNEMLVPEEEFGHITPAWNGIPVPVGHPKVNGTPVSANAPEIVDNEVVGRFYNATVENKRLKGELWIDVDKARRLGHGDLLSALEGQGRVEVSTGFFADLERGEGVFNGKRYRGVWRNIRPDHLALLPNEEGACSWEDGCGAPRTNASGGLVTGAKEAVKALGRALGINVQVEDTMTRDQKVAAIIAASNNGLTEDDKSTLTAMDDATLDKLVPSDEAQVIEVNGKRYTAEEIQALEQKAAKEPPKQPQPATQGAQLSDEDRAALDFGKAELKRRREAAVEKLTANKRFEAGELEGLGLAMLEKMAGEFQARDYSAQGVSANRRQPAQVTPLPVPNNMAQKEG